MAVSQHGFLDELLAEFFPNEWNFDSFDGNPTLAATPNLSFLGFSTTTTDGNPSFECPFNHKPCPFAADGLVVAEMDSSTTIFPTTHDKDGLVSTDHKQHSLEKIKSSSKVEMEQTRNIQGLNMSLFVDTKSSKCKRLEGQPSKNLMAERRRRKRLNDRLSMLRSIVPKISKMDRTSILGDTIDYMKELLERIKKLQEDETKVGFNHLSLLNNMKELKPYEMLVRNSPKFEVERSETDTRIDIRCATKPGLLLSTVNTFEALGLEIQQCVISCFNDFSMQASCSEVAEQRKLMSTENIKQALFRNAGYGGTCL